jgi:arsenite methyltransferase
MVSSVEIEVGLVNPEQTKEEVRRRYAAAALSVREGGGSSCCGSDEGRAIDSEAPGVNWMGGGYSEVERRELSRAAVEASLGCGNPVALATLSPSELVLDLGSGGGIDVLLSAPRVSPGGKVYGLDMTGEMLELARENKRKAGVENAEFLEGEIEDIPLPDDHADVVISNCVINLSAAKESARRRGCAGASRHRQGAAIGVAPASGGEEAGTVISAAHQAGGIRS